MDNQEPAEWKTVVDCSMVTSIDRMLAREAGRHGSADSELHTIYWTAKKTRVSLGDTAYMSWRHRYVLAAKREIDKDDTLVNHG